MTIASHGLLLTNTQETRNLSSSQYTFMKARESSHLMFEQKI